MAKKTMSGSSKNPDKSKWLTASSILAVLSVITGLGALITGGLNKPALSLINLIEILFIILSCIAINISLYRYRSDLKEIRESASPERLTELYNRSNLDPFLENEIAEAERTHQPVSMIMVDLDHFRDISDSYGHAIGDQILSVFAQMILKCIRKTDIIARYGGDEFIVVLPNTDIEMARTVAENIRRSVSEAYVPPVDGVVVSSISCSVGISSYPMHCNNKQSLIKASDLALYKAKKAGRNCTMVYTTD